MTLTFMVTLQGTSGTTLVMFTKANESNSIMTFKNLFSHQYCKPSLTATASTTKLVKSSSFKPLAPTRSPSLFLTQKVAILGPRLPLEAPPVHSSHGGRTDISDSR
ncbi:hypothetical protein H5410_040169 [Solanum commersonii]|uniref:Uncharacterized protein n=1 Tax=Solanum commersonii TaxID=4109 RepID=A0A9J5XQ69_SOLCO|nr:hypothetical protein H5410_040169 [Solanum commersonii]